MGGSSQVRPLLTKAQSCGRGATWRIRRVSVSLPPHAIHEDDDEDENDNTMPMMHMSRGVVPCLLAATMSPCSYAEWEALEQFGVRRQNGSSQVRPLLTKARSCSGGATWRIWLASVGLPPHAGRENDDDDEE